MAKRYTKVSDSKAVSILPQADFTIKDLETIEKFKEDGMLGLHTLVETDVERMMGLYMDGKTYREIAALTKKNKAIILFLAHKFSWFEMRREYLDELHAIMKDKIIDAKLQDQAFLLHLSLAFKKKIGRNIDSYLRTDDVKFADQIDNKDLSTLLKIMELTQRFNSDNPGNLTEKPLVGLNGMGEGVTITKTGTNSVEITPKNSGYSSKLKQFAELKREQEKASIIPPKPTHDISTETLTKNKQESEEK